MYVAADCDTRSYFRELSVWIYLPNHQKKLRFLTLGSRLLLNSSRSENCTQAKTIPRGYQATSSEWIALTPNLQLLKSPPEMVLSQLEDNAWDLETVSRAGAYQTKALLKWSEYHHHQFRRRMAEQHLDQYLLSVIGGDTSSKPDHLHRSSDNS